MPPGTGMKEAMLPKADSRMASLGSIRKPSARATAHTCRAYRAQMTAVFSRKRDLSGIRRILENPSRMPIIKPFRRENMRNFFAESQTNAIRAAVARRISKTLGKMPGRCQKATKGSMMFLVTNRPMKLHPKRASRARMTDRVIRSMTRSAAAVPSTRSNLLFSRVTSPQRTHSPLVGSTALKIFPTQ